MTADVTLVAAGTVIGPLVAAVCLRGTRAPSAATPWPRSGTVTDVGARHSDPAVTIC